MTNPSSKTLQPIPTVKGLWTPIKQLILEKNLTPEQIELSRDALTQNQRSLLFQYLYYAAILPRPAAPPIAIKPPPKTKAEISKDSEEKRDILTRAFDKKSTEIEEKIKQAPPYEQPDLYFQKEQLKEEYEADLRVLEQDTFEDLKRLEKEYWTPEIQLEREKVLTFPQWVEERKKLSIDQIYDIEAYTQGLREPGWTPEIQLDREEGLNFEQWVKERKKLSLDQNYDIEAYTQKLEPRFLTEEEQREAEEEADRRELEQEDIEELKKLEREIAKEKEQLEALKSKPPSEPEIEKPSTTTRPEEEISEPPPELIITRTNYPKWWNDLITRAISIPSGGTQTIAYQNPNYRYFISSINFIVSGETNVTLNFGSNGSSGAMDFGGTDEPRGISMNMGESPAPCGSGGFSINSSASGVNVAGFVVFYQEKIKK